MDNPTGSWSGTRRSFPKRTRARILRRDPHCKLAIEGVCTGTSTEADHITPHAQALALGWPLPDIDSIENGQGVCKPCHQIKTRAEQTEGQRRAATTKPTTRNPEPHPGLVTPH